MPSLDRVLSAFLCEPWGIRPEAHSALGRVLEKHVSGEKLPSDEELRASVTPDAQLAEWRVRGDVVVGPCDCDGNPLIPQMQKVGPVAIIPVFGVLGRHLSFLALWCGGCDFNHVEQMAQLAEGDPNITTIIFYFRSPGGNAVGCEECATAIASLTKQTIAFADIECCSCAMFLAAGCDEILFSPSAMVGSIGCFIAAIDSSKEWENEGLKRELFRSGPLKAAGMSGKPWTDIERATYQARVDEFYGVFAEFVRQRRPNVSDDSLNGAWFTGRDAVTRGLADGNAVSLEALLATVLIG